LTPQTLRSEDDDDDDEEEEIYMGPPPIVLQMFVDQVRTYVQKSLVFEHSAKPEVYVHREKIFFRTFEQFILDAEKC
jgi:hypothetical protein